MPTQPLTPPVSRAEAERIQARAPLFEALREYARLDMAPFHTPGHKQGESIPSEFRELLGDTVFRIDLTELPEVDNLHDPDGVIKEAQELAAAAHGADHTFFLVNGSTTGNNVMVMAACEPGDEILIPRNAHKSVLGGVILSGARPIYMDPVWDPELAVAHGVTPQEVERHLRAHPNAKAVLVVNPTYFGGCSDLAAIARVAHEHGKPLLVDEAHGPHFHFHRGLPLSAIQAGADMVVQSTHKIVSGMTQASMLHLRGERVDVKRTRNVLMLLQSTSPSYVLMASLDVARRQMALEGERLLSGTLALAEQARERLNLIPGISCFGKERCGRPGLYDLDVTKLTINVSGAGLTGFQALDGLNRLHGVQSEMATLHHVLEIVSIGNTQRDLDRLVAGIAAIAEAARNDGATFTGGAGAYQALPPIPEAAVTPRDAFFARTRRVPFGQSAGQVCAEIVAPYPPGIPILTPGERITPEAVEYLLLIHENGGFINGPEDNRLSTIKVVAG